jgi:hypothetical protein
MTWAINMYCEFPYVSGSSTVTGSESEQHVAVFVMCVFRDRPVKAGPYSTPRIVMYLTTRLKLVTTLLKCVLPHLKVTCTSNTKHLRTCCVTF